jgi:acyl carrier protein
MNDDAKLREIFDDILEAGRNIDADRPREQYEKWDSLANVNLLMAINDEFDVKLSLDEMAELNSFSKILALVRSKS